MVHSFAFSLQASALVAMPEERRSMISCSGNDADVYCGTPRSVALHNSQIAEEASRHRLVGARRGVTCSVVSFSFVGQSGNGTRTYWSAFGRYAGLDVSDTHPGSV